jgi:predicted nucleic acid-binding protein
VRLLLAASLAKVHQPQVDIRKPYTEIEGEDTYSGRRYDESFIAQFIKTYDLPCNPTTAFLTPALRNINVPLSRNMEIEGKPKTLYKKALEVLNDSYEAKVSAADVLAETIRTLLIYKETKESSLAKLMENFQRAREVAPLSSEGIVTLIEQHLKSPHASRLPVLVVAAAYVAAKEFLKENPKPLLSHNAADLQTGALGDVEITLASDDSIITSYEMKMKRVSKLDIDHAITKITSSPHEVDNYIFITTDVISEEVATYARGIYDQLGVEVVILDCISFIRHFLHLFHRLRMDFLEEYQRLLLAEPESAVRLELKQSFLALRLAAESRE